MLREKAEKDAERRMKKFEERSKKERDKQKKQFKKYERECGSTIDTYDCTLNGTYVRYARESYVIRKRLKFL